MLKRIIIIALIICGVQLCAMDPAAQEGRGVKRRADEEIGGDKKRAKADEGKKEIIYMCQPGTAVTWGGAFPGSDYIPLQVVNELVGLEDNYLITALSGTAKIGGLSFAKDEEDSLYIDILFVQKQYRKRGIGRQLMNEFFKKAESLKGIREISITACPMFNTENGDSGYSSDSEAAHSRWTRHLCVLVKFYQSFGFYSLEEFDPGVMCDEDRMVKLKRNKPCALEHKEGEFI